MVRRRRYGSLLCNTPNACLDQLDTVLARGVALFLPPIINHVMLSGPNFPALVKYNFGHDFYKQNMIHFTKN